MIPLINLKVLLNKPVVKAKKLKIALVSPPFGEIGGPEVVTKNLAEALSKRDDIEITLFCPKDWTTKNVSRIDTLEKSLWNITDFKTNEF